MYYKNLPDKQIEIENQKDDGVKTLTHRLLSSVVLIFLISAFAEL